MDSDSSGRPAALRDAAIFRRNSFQCSQAQNPHPNPLPSDGRGRPGERLNSKAADLETRESCPLSRRTGEGWGEGNSAFNHEGV